MVVVVGITVFITRLAAAWTAGDGGGRGAGGRRVHGSLAAMDGNRGVDVARRGPGAAASSSSARGYVRM